MTTVSLKLPTLPTGGKKKKKIYSLRSEPTVSSPRPGGIM